MSSATVPSTQRSTETLFRPFVFKGLSLANRIVMAPMTRSKSPHRVPGPEVAAYYRRRAEGGTGLIISEGTFVGHQWAGFDPSVPAFSGDQALAGWRRVVEEVHAAGGKFAPQLWHVGMKAHAAPEGMEIHPVGPANMTQTDIDNVVRAFGQAAKAARDMQCDAIELHGAHGYLIDQFFWEGTNQRNDSYGGSIEARTKFAVDILHEVRRNVGPDYPIILRFSQWKIPEYDAKLAHTPAELERFLEPLVDAGADLLHCSQRRFWEPEFAGSNLNLAGWTKKITGRPTISVGSVTLNQEFMTTFRSDEGANVTGLDELLDRMERDEFDLIAIGRALIANPDWPAKIRTSGPASLRPFHKDVLLQLV